MKDVEITSASDINIDVLNAFKIEFGVKEIYDDFKKLLKNSDVDAIICATPNWKTRYVIWHQIWESFGPSSDWYYDIEKGMGPFVDGAVHSYDFAIFTFGKFKKVKSSLIKFKKFTSPDTGIVSVEFESGDILVLCWSWGLPVNVASQYVHQTFGPEGVLIFGGHQDEKGKYFVVRKKDGEDKQDQFHLILLKLDLKNKWNILLIV